MLGKTLVCFGECMVELSGTAFGNLRQGFGGDTLNTAVYAQRMGQRAGLRVAYATALGDDALSEHLVRAWAAEGLDVSLVRRLPGRMPGLYQIEVDAAGERRFHYWRGQSAAKAFFEDVPGAPSPEQMLEAAGHMDALHFSGISLAILPRAGREQLLALAARLRASGAWVSFDNNYRPRLWADADEARHWFGRALAECNVALLTLDDELLLHPGQSAARALSTTLALPVDEVVVKRGQDSTWVRGADGQALEIATTPAAQVVDSTAAGDSFAGAYLARRLAGFSPQAAAQAANALAARVVQHAGALIPVAAMSDLV